MDNTEQTTGWWARVKASSELMLERYAGPFIVLTLAGFAVELAMWFMLIESGVDLQAVGALVGFELSEWASSGAALPMAYAATRITKFIRLPVTVFITPPAARMWWRMRGHTPPHER